MVTWAAGFTFCPSAHTSRPYLQIRFRITNYTRFWMTVVEVVELADRPFRKWSESRPGQTTYFRSYSRYRPPLSVTSPRLQSCPDGRFCQSGVINKVICDFCQSWVINNLFLITSLISYLFLISYPDSYLLRQTPELYRRYVLSKLGYQQSNLGFCQSGVINNFVLQ